MMAAVFGVVVGILSFWVIVIHHALSENLYMPNQKADMPTLSYVVTNLNYSLSGLGPCQIFGWLPLAALVLALILTPYRHLHSKAGLWMYPVVILGFVVILSFNGAPVRDRHYLALMALLSAMAGIGFRLTIAALNQLAQRLQNRWVGVTSVLVFIGFVGLHENTMLQATLRQNADLVKPDTRALLSEWARTTATEGPMIIRDPVVAVSVQPVYGYRGRRIETPYNEGTFIFPSEITQAMIDAKNIRYIVENDNYDGRNLKVPITRLVVYNDDRTYRGPGWAAFYVGELPKFPPEAYVVFGNQIQLRGFGFFQNNVCPGDTVEMRALWGSVTPPVVNYSYYVHLFSDATGEIGALQNGAPLVSDIRPTSTWLLPGELLVGPLTRVSLAADLKPGTYQAWLGVYDPIAGERLKLLNGADHTVVGALTVRACNAS
jgi:hypothetical protein